MEFSNRLYTIRKQSGLSQEELGNKLNVSRQTVSKWELGESTPDMEKLTMLADLFDISLDELVLGKVPVESKEKSSSIELLTQKLGNEDNKRKMKKGFKILGIILGAVLIIDVISMIIYFVLNGLPK